MALPDAVRKQAEKSDRILEEIKQQESSESSDIIEPEAQYVEQVNELEESETYEQPSTPDWEHKFKVLQGKYDAEVPRLNQELHILRDQNLRLQEQFDSLKAESEERQTEANNVDFTEIRDELGDGVADILTKQQATIDKQNQLIERLSNQINQQGESTKQSAEQMFYSTLKQLAPDWQEINVNPKFIDWLKKVEVYSGKERQALLNEAAGNLDADRVATFFTTWKKDNPGKSKGIEKVVTPKTNKTSTPVEAKKTYSRAEVKKFYDEVARGQYRHDPDKMKKMDHDITRAQAEGRISA